MSIIVLEGPDGAGKSFIASKFIGEPDTVILKQGPPPTSDHTQIMAHYLRPLEEMIGNGTTRYVMDRWHVGELIYGPLLRGMSMLTVQQANYVDMVLQTFGANFTYVTASIQTLEERYDRRGDDLIKRQQLFEIGMEYDDWMVTRPHWEWVESQAWFTPRPRLHSPMAGRYIGPAQPDVLLLGDQRNDHRMIFPFVPERSTSGHWLMTALRDADVNYMRVGVMNACESTTEELAAQWDALGQPRVITLGRNAQRAWKRVGDRDDECDFYLHHPQYERRFHHRKTKRYGDFIRQVMQSG